MAPPPVRGEVDHRAPQVALDITVNPAPVPEDAFECGLQQVLACILAACQEYRGPQQPFAALGQKAGEATNVEWISTAASAQAGVTRELTKAYASAARDLLK